MNEKNPLLVTTPEQAGIPSVAINNFIEKLESEQICMHSFIMVRYGKIAAEGYWKPFDVNRKHRMYSITKSFVSVAIGMMEAEGLLRLDDTVVSFFTDKLPQDGVHKYIAQMTIRDLLRMTTAHDESTYEIMKIDDWLKTFFTVEPSHEPNISFSYDASGSYTLGAIVERLSGMSLLEYLRPRLLEPIGFSEDAYCITCPMGISNGSSGLVCTSRDIAKFALVCMNNGKFDGKQLIPPDYIKAATSFQIATSPKESFADNKEGYGYQFWRCRNNGFACIGRGSQIAICLPDKDFILVTTADTQSNPNALQIIFDTLWEEIYPNLSDNELADDITARNELYDKINSLSTQIVIGKKTSPTVEKINSRIYRLENNPFCIVNVRFDFNGDEGVLEYEKKNQKYKLAFGIGKNISQRFPEYNYDCMSSGAWTNEKTLTINCYITDDKFATLVINAVFHEDTVSVSMKKYADLFLEEYEGAAVGKMF